MCRTPAIIWKEDRQGFFNVQSMRNLVMLYVEMAVECETPSTVICSHYFRYASQAVVVKYYKIQKGHSTKCGPLVHHFHTEFLHCFSMYYITISQSLVEIFSFSIYNMVIVCIFSFNCIMFDHILYFSKMLQYFLSFIGLNFPANSVNSALFLQEGHWPQCVSYFCYLHIVNLLRITAVCSLL
jgi:hypothetical protein